MFLFLGIDALGPNVFKKLYGKHLPFIRSLAEKYSYSEIYVEDACSPKIWTEMFSGTYLDWYRVYIKPGENGKWRPYRRDEIPVKFVWDIRKDLVVINAPVLTPPVCLNTGFKPVAYGFPVLIHEMVMEVSEVEKHTIAALENGRDVISVFTALDRCLHITAIPVEIATVLERLDRAVNRIISLAEKKGYRWILASDHDMRLASKEKKAEVKPLPDIPYLPSLKTYIHRHDHYAVAITNTGRKFRSHREIYEAILEELSIK